MDTKTVITTAEGDIKEFGGFVAKLIVAHPRLAALIALLLGFAVGRLL